MGRARGDRVVLPVEQVAALKPVARELPMRRGLPPRRGYHVPDVRAGTRAASAWGTMALTDREPDIARRGRTRHRAWTQTEAAPGRHLPLCNERIPAPPVLPIDEDRG
jgi:hypothetical protein